MTSLPPTPPQSILTDEQFGELLRKVIGRTTMKPPFEEDDSGSPQQSQPSSGSLSSRGDQSLCPDGYSRYRQILFLTCVKYYSTYTIRQHWSMKGMKRQSQEAGIPKFILMPTKAQINNFNFDRLVVCSISNCGDPNNYMTVMLCTLQCCSNVTINVIWIMYCMMSLSSCPIYTCKLCCKVVAICVELLLKSIAIKHACSELLQLYVPA